MNPCPLCRNLFSILKYKLEFNIYQCNNCGFQFCPDAKFDKSFNSNLDEESKKKALKNLRAENFSKITKSIKNATIHEFMWLKLFPSFIY